MWKRMPIVRTPWAFRNKGCVPPKGTRRLGTRVRPGRRVSRAIQVSGTPSLLYPYSESGAEATLAPPREGRRSHTVSNLWGPRCRRAWSPRARCPVLDLQPRHTPRGVRVRRQTPGAEDPQGPGHTGGPVPPNLVPCIATVPTGSWRIMGGPHPGVPAPCGKAFPRSVRHGHLQTRSASHQGPPEASGPGPTWPPSMAGRSGPGRPCPSLP